MITEFYDVESCEELMAEIGAATDSMKYLLSLPKSFEDSKLLTPEMIKAYEDIAGSCEDYLSGWKYYSKAKLYTAKNPDELVEKTHAAIKAVKGS